MNAEKTVGPKRKRVLDALNHREPDRVPVDFGGSAVTGMNVSCVANLRDHYGLEKRPVKVIEFLPDAWAHRGRPQRGDRS